MPVVVQQHGDRRWVILAPGDKLRARGALPGAHVFDQAAHVVRVLQPEGADALALLPLVMPGSWLVNARASSRAFRAWLSGAGLDAWRTVLGTIDESLGPDGWLDLPASAQDECVSAIGVLATTGEGASLAAVSKVLAILRPQVVPLMDDAALSFALGVIPVPATADEPRAPPSLFGPMMDWFSRSVLDNEKVLAPIAVDHATAILDGAQALDRLLWWESWGWRADRRFSWVIDGEREGIALAPRPSEEDEIRAIAIEELGLEASATSALRDELQA